MSEEERRILHMILDTQEGCQKLIVESKAQIDALTYALIRLAPHAATLYSEQLEIEQKKQAALLELGLKQIALLRVAVSKTVH